jgi:hypothetical protein
VGNRVPSRALVDLERRKEHNQRRSPTPRGCQPSPHQPHGESKAERYTHRTSLQFCSEGTMRLVPILFVVGLSSLAVAQFPEWEDDKVGPCRFTQDCR